MEFESKDEFKKSGKEHMKMQISDQKTWRLIANANCEILAVFGVHHFCKCVNFIFLNLRYTGGMGGGGMGGGGGGSWSVSHQASIKYF